MRLFQNSGLYPAYLSRLRRLTGEGGTFAQQMNTFLADCYGGLHILEPVLKRAPEAFLANGDNVVAQRAWARENGMPANATPSDILLAQIESHRTEVFYNLDPLRFGSTFLKRLPGCVKHSIAWRAAPSPGADFAGYDAMVCNFPSILESYRRQGLRTAYFAPAFDPEMTPYARNESRPIDIVFVGGYTRHHMRRARILEAVARLHDKYQIVFHLEPSRLVSWAESPLGRLLPLAQHRRPHNVRQVAQPSVFGRDLYQTLSRAKLVLNAAIDMAGDDRGNMRCFEAMGAGSLLLTDDGHYPEGMRNGETMLTYGGTEDIDSRIRAALEDISHARTLAKRGHDMIATVYSKRRQWAAFEAIVATL